VLREIRREFDAEDIPYEEPKESAGGERRTLIQGAITSRWILRTPLTRAGSSMCSPPSWRRSSARCAKKGPWGKESEASKAARVKIEEFNRPAHRVFAVDFLADAGFII